MRKEVLNEFNNALYRTYECAAEHASSEYDGHRYVRRALIHYLVSGEVDKFPDEESRALMEKDITRDEVARHFADNLYQEMMERDPKTRVEKRFKSKLEELDSKGVNEGIIMSALIRCILNEQKDFYGIGSDYISSLAIRLYEEVAVGRKIEEQKEYELRTAMLNDNKYGITSVKINAAALNQCRQEIIDGSQIEIQNGINAQNEINGTTLQRPRREYSLDEELFAVSDIGTMRKDQEDSVLILRHPLFPECKMLVVADGVGGSLGGEKASHEVVLQMLEWFEGLNPLYLKEKYKNELMEMWSEKIQETNKKVYNDFPGAGTTFVGAIVGEETTIVSSVGDSRAYLLGNDNELRQITVDDNFGYKNWEAKWGKVYKESRSGQAKVTIEKMLDEKDKVRFSDQSYLIYASIGAERRVRPKFITMPNTAYKTLLLLSDGVTDCLSDKQLMAITRDSKPQDIAKSIVNEALHTDSHREDLKDKEGYKTDIPGGKDNTTAAVYIPKKEGEQR